MRSRILDCSWNNRGLVAWATPLALLLFAAAPCQAMVVNGTFDSGLSGWTSEGDVTAAGDATVGDSGALYSLLFQPVALAPGQYTIEFDFFGLLSGDLSADPFAFPDTFFASLYFVNDAGTLDIANGIFDDVTPLLDLDELGPFNVAGTLDTSPLGPDWTHFSYTFTNNYAYVIPAFELLDFNFIAGDSQVRLDNVSLSTVTGVIPEPATLSLLFMGLLGCAARRARNTRNA